MRENRKKKSTKALHRSLLRIQINARVQRRGTTKGNAVRREKRKKKETDMENMKEGKDESLASARRVGVNRLHFSGEELYWLFLTCRGAQFMAHYTKKKKEEP